MAGAEHAQAGAGGAGECAALVTEELAFRQRRRQRRTIDGNKCFVATRTQAMEQPGPNFFAGAGFARDQHRAFDLRSALGMMGDAPYRAIAANDQTGWIFRREVLEQTQRMR